MTKINKYFPVGTAIQWKWMGNVISGVVVESFTEPICKVIKGKAIKRNGTIENPAFLVQSLAGNLALKLQSELQLPSEDKKVDLRKPTMFSK